MGGSSGASDGKRMRDVCPCDDCYEALRPHFAPMVELVLFEPTRLQGAHVFSAAEHGEAYAPKPPSTFVSNSRPEIIREIRQKTPLRSGDQEIVADLRLLGLDRDLQLYLTGSSSGRGWMSNQIHLRQGTAYEDLDIVAVTTEYNQEQASSMVRAIMERHLGPLTQQQTIADIWMVSGSEKGQTKRIVYDSFFCKDKKVMDLLVATTLEDGMVREDYLAKNFYHRIA